MFSCGLELADLMVASNLLHRLWAVISELYSSDRNEPNSPLTPPFSVRYKTFQQQPDCTIIAFVPSSSSAIHHRQGGGGGLFLSSTFQQNNPLLQFLCTENNPSFHINEEAFAIFTSLSDKLSCLQQQFSPNSRLIVTGHGLGGAVASLYTLWLLNNIPPNAKPPLCITFGSPLVGDDGLRKTILCRSTWNSRFLHVVSHDDPIPRLSVSEHSYKPLGTFLMCSPSGCACLDDPESILRWMALTGPSENPVNPGQADNCVDYGTILGRLKDSIANRAAVLQIEGPPLRASILLQLEAMGFGEIQLQQQQQLNQSNLVTVMERWVREKYLNKEKRISDDKKLNDAKIYMAHLEWYKKVCECDPFKSYYDCYKSKMFPRDMDAAKFKNHLTNYWKTKVEEAEKQPKKDGLPLQTRWIFGGTNYRRMVEPLDIADYYNKEGNKDYFSNGRSPHYKLLEKWEKEARGAEQQKNDARRQIASLTEDSCFWAHLEEAKLSLKNGESITNFENYVMTLINNFAVSREIFREKSSFMEWWRAYESILQPLYRSEFTDYMKNKTYLQYGA
ncbi:PREDICTED: senescence-associated carboxylesterase 101-like [Nelumbo nucifera]|nr:PREDICTED: senescence-associated carboxylesterase 101-like [Nelumbo nucifera]